MVSASLVDDSFEAWAMVVLTGFFVLAAATFFFVAFGLDSVSFLSEVESFLSIFFGGAAFAGFFAVGGDTAAVDTGQVSSIRFGDFCRGETLFGLGFEGLLTAIGDTSSERLITIVHAAPPGGEPFGLVCC